VEPPSISPDFAKSVDDSATLKKVTDYLHTLSSREQEIVFLRVWDDLDYKEISEILGISVDNCKKIYSRSIKKVQANLATMLLFILLFL
jgi:RNA polymerase sigma factor (sigma-70 family)